jgi:hypothetical protein
MIEVIPKTILMRETTNGLCCGVIGARLRHQHFATAYDATRGAPHPGVTTFAILPKDL